MNIARLMLLGTVLPLAAFAQVELTVFNPATAQETPVGAMLDFGTAAVGSAVQLELHIRDIGASAITIDTLQIDPGPFSVSNAPLVPFNVGAGSFQVILLSFAPSTPAPYTATLTVDTLTTQLTGQGLAGPQLAAGSQVLTAGGQIYVGRTQVGTPIQLSLTLSNPWQMAMDIQTLSVSGQDFSGPTGLTAPFTLNPGDVKTFQVSFTPSLAHQETGTLTLNTLTWTLAGDGFVAPFPQASIVLSSNAPSSAAQVQLSVRLASPAQSSAAGQLQLDFQPANGLSDDPAIQFLANGKRVINLNVSPGASAASFDSAVNCTFQTGTTAGTITFTLTLGGATEQATVAIPPQQISLDTMTAVQTANEVLVSLDGYDNTHGTSMLSFRFYDAGGKVISPGQISVDAAGAFGVYYSTYPQVGGTFALQAAFPVSGDITQVSGVEVQLTNPQGTYTTARLPVN